MIAGGAVVTFVILVVLSLAGSVGCVYLGPRLLVAGWKSVRKREWTPPDGESRRPERSIRGWKATVAGVFAMTIGIWLLAMVPAFAYEVYRVSRMMLDER
jgi:hypothetical protein